MKENKVTAIVPVYNEETRVAGVIKGLLDSPLIDQLIIVNDGSTDNSINVIKSFNSPKIIVVDNEKNLGKGGAVRKGLERVKTPITFLCDADIAGINNQEIEKIVSPVTSGKFDACVGILYRGKFLQFFRRRMTVLTGERVVKTDILREVMESPYTERWGIELYMNFYFRHHGVRTKIVDLNVGDYMQMQKVGFIKWLYARPVLLTGILLRILLLEIEFTLGVHDKDDEKDFHKSHFKLWYVWATIIARFLSGVYILFNPFFGFIFMLVADYFDAYFLKHRARMTWWEYHRLDKYLDWTNYIFMLVVAIRFGVFGMLIGWLIFRLIGQIVFLKTHKTVYFLLFPNFYEFAFLWYVVILGVFKFDGAGYPSWAWLGGLFVLKEMQELWLHFVWPRYLKKHGYPSFMHKIGYEKDIVWE